LKFLLEQRDRLQVDEMELQKQLEEIRKTWRTSAVIGGYRGNDGVGVMSGGGALSPDGAPLAPGTSVSSGGGSVPTAPAAR
jgi:hypothetical protein